MPVPVRPMTSKFIPAPNQTEEERKRLAVLRHIMHTEKGTRERGAAIDDAVYHHDVKKRTVQHWVKQAEDHGWDLNAFGRKRPSDAGQQRVWVSRPFDKAFRAAGRDHSELVELAEWLRRILAGCWQSPLQRAGWKRIRLETLTCLRTECAKRGIELPENAFHLSRRTIEELRYHQIVDIAKNDAKRFDDMKPRIFDEAQYLSREAIEMLRFWNDRDRTTTPFPVGLIFVGNNEFAMAETLAGESVLSGAVRSRLLYELPLAYTHLADTDLTIFAQSRGVTDGAALREFVGHFKDGRAKRDLRLADRQLAVCRREAGDAPISLDLIRDIITGG